MSNNPTGDPTQLSKMENINIAVIGAAGVGKSTVIQHALGLKSLPTAVISSLKMSVDNIVYTVALVELDLESFNVRSDRRVQWPKQIKGEIMPRLDGSLLLYDVMNEASIADLPQTLDALLNSAMPTILVSCKCDNPVGTRQINIENVQAACLAEVEAVNTAANIPESARLCLGAMLRAIMVHRNAVTSESGTSRRRAASSAALESIIDTSERRPPSPQGKHSRASSEFSILRGFPPPPGASSRAIVLDSRKKSTGKPVNQYQSKPNYAESSAKQLDHVSTHRSLTGVPSPYNDTNHDDKRTTGLVDEGNRARITIDAFLDLEESDADSSYRYSDDIPILQRNDDTFADRPSKVSGTTFDALVDRLLAQHMSKADVNFLEIFLCLYRKFAAPEDLFSAIVNRFEQIGDDKAQHALIRTSTQLRLIVILTKWLSSYPGDFASPRTSQSLTALIEQLSLQPAFASAAREMRVELKSHVVENDDTGWERTDLESGFVLGPMNNSSTSISSRTITDQSSQLGKPLSISSPADDSLESTERRQSQAASLSSGDAGSMNISRIHGYHSVEDYEAEAATMIPSNTMNLNKIRYHNCMDISDNDFADEITRIDWVMFSSIRVRDLVRHVSLSQDQKARCKSLVNVNRMINHFNHVARWVSNMILFRDKAKHRAQILEKFMRIAVKLRELNNYNGLAAVIAGINSLAVHRLAQTRALVPAECQKRFMRLELLMSTQKSHFAYRLAWENSPLPRIPFIPLHRRDLVSAEEGSKTFTGPNADRINWKKFEVLAEVLLPIMRSQSTPYPNLERHDIVRELILDCKITTDEEEIYQRSLLLETSTNTMDATKKKFPWFQK